MENPTDEISESSNSAQNICDILHHLAARDPQRPAILYSVNGQPNQQWTFAELDTLVSQYAAGWQHFGLAPGERVLILARPDQRFTPLLLGLIRAGGSVVLVDPGRPLAEMLACISQAAPDVLVAPCLVHLAAWLLPALRAIRRRVVSGGRLPGAASLAGLLQAGAARSARPTTTPNSEAALIFTTGSTGQPKGVVYTHATLLAQYRALKTALQLGPAETGLFGPSAMMLLGLLAGVTVVLGAELSLQPAQIDLRNFTRLLLARQVTLTFAAPFFCRRLAAYCQERGLRFPNLRQVVVGGAEVDLELVRSMQALLPNGDVIISLGSTEISPAALISGRRALTLQPPPPISPANCPPGAACAGYPAPDHELAIIPIRDEPISTWDETLRLPPGQVGEIVIRGPAVTEAYLAQPDLTARAKILAGEQVWHRMGDLGCLDADGCLWFVGRKTQRVETGREVLFTVPCEAVFNQHPSVARSALVGQGTPGRQTALIVIETKPGQSPRSAAEKATLIQALRELANAHPHTRAIHDFIIYPGVFPVDIRHQSKILREKLVR